MDYLASHKHQNPTLLRRKSKLLGELKKDKDRTILTADKGVAMVVLDKKDYLEKAKELLVQLLTGP